MTSTDEADTKEYPCLVRVTDGKELNLSTRVRALACEDDDCAKRCSIHFAG